jgi:hypothetical protein
MTFVLEELPDDVRRLRRELRRIGPDDLWRLSEEIRGAVERQRPIGDGDPIPWLAEMIDLHPRARTAASAWAKKNEQTRLAQAVADLRRPAVSDGGS